MKPLTTKQYALLRYMYDYEQEHGYPALIKELAAYCGVSYMSISQRVQVLQRLGYVEYVPKRYVRALYMPGMGDIARTAA